MHHTTAVSSRMSRAAGGLAALSATLMMTLAAQAHAQSAGGAPAAAPAKPAAEGTGPMRHHAMGDPDKMAERMTERMAKAADASPEQTAKLMEISKKAAVDLKPLHEQQRGVRQKIMVLLSSPTLDRAALEQLRVQYMQAMDAISKRRLQSMADGAEVLRPEQRAKLAVHMKERMTRGGAGAGDWTPRR